MFRIQSPSPPLARYVEMFWYYDGYQDCRHRERILPGGSFTLLIELTGGPGVVTGMRSTYIEVDTTAIHSVMGVGFRPGRARPFFDGLANEFYNQAVTLDLLWGHAAHELRGRLREAPTVAEKFRLLEIELLRRLRPGLELHPAVRYGLSNFRRTPDLRTVREISQEAGLSRQRFTQVFREQVGVTPKLYCRLHRFKNVLCRIASGAFVDWADVALAGGYSDQAHMSHEFREFSGFSPGSFLVAERPFAAHVRVD